MSFEEKKEKSLADFITLFNTSLLKYWRIALGPALVLFGLSLFASFKADDYFKSDFLIYIQPQKFENSLLDGTEPGEMKERMDALLQEILSKNKVRALIEKFDLYPTLSKSKAGMEIALLKFHNARTISPVKSVINAQDQKLAFRVAFTHNNPNTAFKVAKEISELFISESVINDQSKIRGELGFLESELEEARKQLEGMEKQRKEFIQGNFDTLPQNLNAAIARLENAQAQLASNTAMISSALVRRENLQRDYSLLKNRLPQAGTIPQSGDPVESIAQLESALSILLSRYHEKHPDVVQTKKRISALREQVKSGGGSPSRGPIGESMEARSVRLQRQEVGIRVSELEKENEVLKETIAKLERDIPQMPIKEHELLKINRDYANVEATYQKLLTAKQSAGLKDSLIQGQKASQFQIIDQAELPNIPAGPDRPLMMIGGLLGAISLFFLIPFLTSMFNSSYKFSTEVENELDLEVIGVIPPMVTPFSVIEGRRVNAMASIASVMMLVLGAAILFFSV